MSETRALLLTDIVDSTEIASRLGDDEAATLNAAHDRVARDLLRKMNGREIDKTDGMLMLFDSAADAAGYALSYHQALAVLSVPLKARAGLHVGAVVLRVNGAEDVARGAKPLEVHGIAKSTAARVMALALGGQTLLTAAARDALGDASLHLQSHGHWKLKGVPEPMELFELGDEGARFATLPDTDKAYRVIREGEVWLPLRDIRHNLPAERDAFVGRLDALSELAHRFESGARLVSILGMGGTGKTRLATYFAWAQLGEFAGGEWFCDLSQARDINGIVRAVAQGLEVPLGKEDPVIQLAYAIAGRKDCLVILDNFEQVARHAQDTLGQWLDRAAEAKFIVTTREVLGLPGEEALALAPLPVADAVTLFTKRALSAKYDFAPGEDDHAAIAQLVKLLDGLPLAVELAAARARVMSPRMLLSRMDQRFRLLIASGGRHDRQATLRTTFDWSWDLLAPVEKSALAQLSVFDGGFTIESAEAVLDLSGDGAVHWAVDIVQSLVDKSFVRTVSDARFNLLASIQDYAAEHLRTPGRFDGSGPAALAAAEVRHLEYFASISDREATSGDCVELDNLVTACRRACTGGRADLAVTTLERAWNALKLHGPFMVGVELAASVHELPHLSDLERARASQVAGDALRVCGRVAQARPHFETALRAARAAGHRSLEGHMLRHLGDALADEHHGDEAQRHYADALSIARDLGDRTLERAALNGIGLLYEGQGRLNEARDQYMRALRVARAAADDQGESSVLGNLGNINASLGHLADARADYEAGLLAARKVGDRRMEGNALSNLGLLHFVQRRLADARPLFEASLAVARELGNRRLEGVALCNLGLVCEAQDRQSEAHALLELAVAAVRDINDRYYEGQFLGYLGISHAHRRRFEVARQCLDDGETLLADISDPLSLAQLRCARAEVEHLSGQPDSARRALDEALRLAASANAGQESELGIALARVERLIEEDWVREKPDH